MSCCVFNDNRWIIDALKKELDAARAAHEEARKEVEDLKEQVEYKQSLFEAMGKECSRHIREKDRLKEELAEAKGARRDPAIHHMNDIIKAKHTAMANLQQEIKSRDETIEQNEHDIRRLKDQLHGAQNTNSFLMKQVKEMRERAERAGKVLKGDD